MLRMSNVELIDQFKNWLLSKKNNSEITEATYQSFLSALGNNDLSSADSQTVSKYIAKIFNDLSEGEIINGDSLFPYRTKNKSNANDLDYPENLALPTIPKYQFAMSMLQRGEAYLQGGIDTDCLKFRNGKLFFEDATGVLQRVSEVELQNFRTRESITKINGLPILRAFYTIFLTNYHDAIIKKEPLPKFIKIYLPDFINYIGLKRNSDKKTIDSIINQMSSFHNVIGVMEIKRNGRDGKSYYPVLNFEGYDEKSNTIEVSSPYLFHIIELIYQATLVIDKRSKQPKLKKNGEPLRLPSHSYMVKSSISSERNQAAVENVVIITAVIEQAGDNTPLIRASTIIERNSQFKERLEESKNPNQLLQRTFKRTWELLREQTRLKEFYKDIQLPDPEDSKNIPTMKTLNRVFEFPHKGKCDSNKNI